MAALLPLPQPAPVQVLPLCAVVFSEFTPTKRRAHHTRNKHMANATPFSQPGKSLEITLQDSLDSLGDFTLQMAYSATGTQFEILSIDNATESENNLPAKPVPLTLVTTSDTNNNFQTTTRRRRRI